MALTDTSFMPRPWEMKEKFDMITADFAYVRWLGDRKAIEEQTTWDKAIVDRTSDFIGVFELWRRGWDSHLEHFSVAGRCRVLLGYLH